MVGQSMQASRQAVGARSRSIIITSSQSSTNVQSPDLGLAPITREHMLLRRTPRDFLPHHYQYAFASDKV